MNESDDADEEMGGEVGQGRWTREEHLAFVKGLELYGKGWKKIALLIKTRTVVQVRTHAQKYFLKLQKTRNNDIERGKTFFPLGKKKKHRNLLVSVSPPLQPFLQADANVSHGLYKFLSPPLAQSSIPLPSAVPSYSIGSLQHNNNCSSLGTYMCSDKPAWFQRGEDVKTLLQEAEGLDWMLEAGQGVEDAPSAHSSQKDPSTSPPTLLSDLPIVMSPAFASGADSSGFGVRRCHSDGVLLSAEAAAFMQDLSNRAGMNIERYLRHNLESVAPTVAPTASACAAALVLRSAGICSTLGPAFTDKAADCQIAASSSGFGTYSNPDVPTLFDDATMCFIDPKNSAGRGGGCSPTDPFGVVSVEVEQHAEQLLLAEFFTGTLDTHPDPPLAFAYEGGLADSESATTDELGAGSSSPSPRSLSTESYPPRSARRCSESSDLRSSSSCASFTDGKNARDARDADPSHNHVFYVPMTVNSFHTTASDPWDCLL